MKKAERSIDAFELWRWRRFLKVPWTARRSSQSILKEISLEYSLEGLMLKLKLQYFGHLMWRTDSLEEILMLAGGEGGNREWDGWMVSLTQWIWVWAISGRWWSLVCCSPWCLKESDTTGQLNNNNKDSSFRAVCAIQQSYSTLWMFIDLNIHIEDFWWLVGTDTCWTNKT